jgi:hypothetical protein
MVDREEFKRWMKQAEHTLESARRDAANGDFGGHASKLSMRPNSRLKP